jgi:tight adherence protein C
LANELRIVERETQMGRTTGEAMRNFAARFDLAELRSMASVITQAERFGTSVVKALTVYADTMRVKRQQVAEERAHKAVVKIIFPTVLFIFPAIFVVILGPAVIQIFEAFEKTGVGNATGL